ncbi:hypothetical protein N0V88_005687 [Collariella sp. IMI 366227]|nr:hypothetical protein N0V88_005687 [Collariella sp. IMI 366227]
MRLTVILSSLLLSVTGQVIDGGWTAFGDSYAAGIGAGGKHPSDTGQCRRRVNAYPNQIQADGTLAAHQNVDFNFLACSSAKIPNVQTQIETFRDGDEKLRGFATISIGGNDAGFSNVIEACLVRARFGSPSCDTVLESTTATVNSGEMRQNLENTYRSILDAAKAPGKVIVQFRLVVTGYPRFFNEDTTGCNDKHMSFWGLVEPKKQYLTVERRKALNKLVTDMNNVVKAAAETVSRDSLFGQVVFVSIDELFEGHRFCEQGVNEPDNKTPNTWFFLLQGRDAAPDGSLLPPSYPDEPANLTPGECEALLNGETPPFGDGWGEFMLCAAQQGAAEGKQPADWIFDDGNGNDDFSGINLPEAWGKAFHPKSIGHARIRQAIVSRLTGTGANFKQVLIMHEGSQEEFDAMVNLPFNSKLDAQRIEQPGINLRGYSVWMETSAARKIRDTVPGVVGVIFEVSNELPPVWPNGAATQNAARAVNTTQREVGHLKKRIASAATTTDLDLERHLYALGDNVNIWHLLALSQPPAVPDPRFLEFPGYIHDPNGGSGVNVYVLDSGANLDHHEISSRLRTDGLVSYVTLASKLGVINDEGGHGTCMASLIGGKKYGVTKTGKNIIPVKWEKGEKTGAPKGASLFEALLWILSDVKAHGKQGKAVINYSGGVAIAKWADDEDIENADRPESPIYFKYDPWRWFLPYFAREDVVVVCAAGNSASAPEDWWVEFPRRHAHEGFVGQDTLIVVGGTDQDGKIWKAGNAGSNRFFSLITAFAPAQVIKCAAPSGPDAEQEQSGTSCSTALVSGLIATFLDRADLQGQLQVPGSVAARVKAFVKEAAQYHTDQSIIDPESGAPLNVLGTHNYVPCNTPVTQYPGGQIPSVGNTFPVRRGDTFYNPATPSPFTYQGCMQQQTELILREGSSKQQTLEACASTCQAFAFFGMAHGNDCYCGSVTHNAIPADDTAACSEICPGDSSEICGGAQALSLYGGNANPDGGVVGAVPGWTYGGCYVDGETRTLKGNTMVADDMTPTKCAVFCEGAGYSVFGMENGNECWCGSSTPDASLISPDGGCVVRCNGDAALLCGGGWRMTLYRKQGLDVSLVDGWQYSSCYVDSEARVLAVGKGTSEQMTPGITPTCPSTIACDATNCAGTFDSGGSRATCKSTTLSGCVCRPAASTCGNPASCDAGGCAGTFDSNGQATCKGNYATCRCLPQAAQCGTAQSCNLNGCAGTFDANGQATLWRGGVVYCEWSEQCGAAQSCNANGCAGTFDSNGQATCKGAYAGCRCLPQSEQCGTAQSCNLNGCAGTFDSNGQATCKGAYAGCRCLPQSEQCGTAQSCNANGCAGTFDSNGQATCKGAYAGCRCLPQAEQCGAQASCDAGGCAGSFDSDGFATCKGNYATCRCNPTAATCGNPQSCDAGGCAGTFNSNGIATCKGKYATCRCNPTTNTCGAQASLNGCAGTFNSNTGKATCKGRYATCPCVATTDMCGDRQSCDLNNCAGRFTGNEPYGHCTNWWAPCECLATATTCGARQSCDLNGCNGSFDVNSLQPYCRTNFRGCASNVPSDWNDRIYVIGFQEDGYNCELHKDINCSGGSVFYTGRGTHNLPSGMGGQISSFKCWRSDGNNNSPSPNG